MPSTKRKAEGGKTKAEATLIEPLERIAEAAARVSGLAAERDRGDLAERLDEELARPSSAALVVIGGVSKGKSSLINALLSRDLLSIDPDVATRAHVQIKYAPELVIRELDSGREFAVGDIDSFWAERSSSGSNTLEIGLPHPLLERGLMIVDTPGFGGLSAANDAITTAALSKADAALMVMDAAGPVSKTEIDFFRDAAEHVPTVLAVLTKTDDYHGWREILAEDQAVLDRYREQLGPIEILPFSATLKLKAGRFAREGHERQARVLRDASGIGPLEQLIAERVLGDADLIRAESLDRAVQHTIDELTSLDRVEAAGSPKVGDESAAANSMLVALDELEIKWKSAVDLAYGKLKESLGRECARATLQMQDEWQSKLREAGSGDPHIAAEGLEDTLVAKAIELTTWLQGRLAAATRVTLVSLGLPPDLLASTATAGPLDPVAAASPPRTSEGGLLAVVGGAAGLKKSFGDLSGFSETREGERQDLVGDVRRAIENTVSVELRRMLEKALSEARGEQDERFAAYLLVRRGELARSQEAHEQARSWSDEEARERKGLAEERLEEIHRLQTELKKAQAELEQRPAPKDTIADEPVLTKRPRVFISYFRLDCFKEAGWLRDNLQDRAGADVFYDIEDIPIGVDFAVYYKEQVSSCDLLIALIGDEWLTLEGVNGRPRISDPEEHVHQEIRAALDRDVPVLPVLVDGMEMPRPEELPEGLRPIGRVMAAKLHGETWRKDFDKVIEFIHSKLMQ